MQNRERKSTNKTINEKQSFFTRVIITQLVMSLLITGILYAVCRGESALSQNIKNFYTEISEEDIAVSSLFNTFKNVVKQTFSPNVKEEKNIENIAGEEVNFSPDFIFGEIL